MSFYAPLRGVAASSAHGWQEPAVTSAPPTYSSGSRGGGGGYSPQQPLSAPPPQYVPPSEAASAVHYSGGPAPYNGLPGGDAPGGGGAGAVDPRGSGSILGENFDNTRRTVLATFKNDPWKVVVLKATTSDPLPPKTKHVHAILSGLSRGGAVHSRESDVGAVMYHLRKRLAEREWTVVLKALTIWHHIMREGNQVFVEYVCEHCRTELDLRAYQPTATSAAYASFIQCYSAYLVQRCSMRHAIHWPEAKATVEAPKLAESVAARYRRSAAAGGDAHLQRALRELPVTMDTLEAITTVPLDVNIRFAAVSRPTLLMLARDAGALMHVVTAAMDALLREYYEESASFCRQALPLYERFVRIEPEARRLISELIGVGFAESQPRAEPIDLKLRDSLVRYLHFRENEEDGPRSPPAASAAAAPPSPPPPRSQLRRAPREESPPPRPSSHHREPRRDSRDRHHRSEDAGRPRRSTRRGADSRRRRHTRRRVSSSSSSTTPSSEEDERPPRRAQSSSRRAAPPAPLTVAPPLGHEAVMEMMRLSQLSIGNLGAGAPMVIPPSPSAFAPVPASPFAMPSSPMSAPVTPSSPAQPAHTPPLPPRSNNASPMPAYQAMSPTPTHVSMPNCSQMMPLYAVPMPQMAAYNSNAPTMMPPVPPSPQEQMLNRSRTT